MAFETLGLGAVLTMDPSQALKGMNRARAAFVGLGASAKKAQVGIQSMSMGFMKLSLAGAGAALVVGGFLKSSMRLESQMSAVKAVSGATADQMADLTAQAKKLGATTAFTATEAAEGMEQLARSGFKVNEILAATPAVLNAAAADSMELADASRIVAGVLRGMRLPAEQAGHVADVLAATSANSATNITQLGDAFRYAAPQAAAMGFSLEETAAALGKAADAQLIGSIGGTSFTNMLTKIAKPTSVANKLMKKWGIALTQADGSMRPLSALVGDFKVNIDAMTNRAERSAAVIDIFGRRGAKAFNALSAAGPEALADMTKMLEQSSEGVGAAAKMAQTRLDNVQGAITILKSAWEGLSIEIGDYLIKNTNLKAGIQSLTKFISNLVLVLQGETEGFHDLSDPLTKFNLLTSTAGKVALGLKDGLKFVSDGLKSAVEWITSVGEKFGLVFGGDMIRTVAKVVTVLTVALAAIAPIGAAALILGFALSGIWSIVSGLGTVISALAGPLGIVLAAAVAGFMAIRREGESISGTLFRIFKVVQGAFKSALESGKLFAAGLQEGIAPALEVVGDVFATVRKEATKAHASLMDVITVGGTMETDWKAIGNTVGSVFSTIAKFFGPSIKSFVKSMINVGSTLAESIIPSLKGIWTILKPILAITLLPSIGPMILSFKLILPLLGWIAEGLAVVVGWLAKATGWVGEKLGAAWDWVVEKVKPFWAFLVRLKDFAFNIGFAYGKMIRTLALALMEKLAPAFIWIRDVAVAVWKRIVKGATRSWNWITSKVIDPAAKWIVNTATWIKDTWIEGFKMIRDFAVSIFSKLAPIIAAPFKVVLDFITSVLQKIAGTEVGKIALEAAGLSSGAIKTFVAEVKGAKSVLAGGATAQQQAAAINKQVASLETAAGEKLAMKAVAGSLGVITAGMKQAIEAGQISANEKSPAAKAMKASAEHQGQVVGSQQPCITNEVKNKIDVNSNLSVDGSEMSVATANHQIEISDRAGASTTPFQKRKVLETGAIPAAGGVTE